MVHPIDGRSKSHLQVLRVLFAFSVALLLIGCEGDTTPTTMPTPIPTPTSPPPPAGASLPTRIRARGYLVVGVRYDLPPFSYVTEEGTVDGFDVELGRELARRWLGNPGAVIFRQVRSDTAVEHILAGDVDLVLTALLHNQEAEGQVDFGPPLFEDGQALLVHATDALSITTTANLEGRSVAVVSGSGAADAVWASVTFTPTFANYNSFDEALGALSRGEVSAVADLRRRLVRGLADVPGTVIVGQYSQALLAPAYAHNEPGLADLVALTLQEMFSDNSFYELYWEWFSGDASPTLEIWPGTATTTLEGVESTTRAPDTIASIQGRGRLRVAMVSNRSPFSYLDVNGEPAGYEVNLVRLMASRWLGDQTSVDFLPANPGDGLRMLSSGGADMFIGAVEHTREAELLADFSLTTYIAGEGLMVRAGTALGGLAGLEGQTVAAVSGTNSGDLLRQMAQSAQVSLVILPKATMEEAMAALEAGEVIAVVGNRADLLGPAYATPGIGVTTDRFTQIPLAFALPPGDSAFRDLVNLTLQAMSWDGQLGVVYDAWFDDGPFGLEPWPGSPGYPLWISTTQ